ncbi:hypothetical protein YC2023_116178 [Brassica napus]
MKVLDAGKRISFSIPLAYAWSCLHLVVEFLCLKNRGFSSRSNESLRKASAQLICVRLSTPMVMLELILTIGDKQKMLRRDVSCGGEKKKSNRRSPMRDSITEDVAHLRPKEVEYTCHSIVCPYPFVLSLVMGLL